jgi:hypothetical protein
MSLIAKVLLKQVNKQIAVSNGFIETSETKFFIDYKDNLLWFIVKGIEEKTGDESTIISKKVPATGEGAEKWGAVTGLLDNLKAKCKADEMLLTIAVIDTKKGGFECECYFIRNEQRLFTKTFLSI